MKKYIQNLKKRKIKLFENLSVYFVGLSIDDMKNAEIILCIFGARTNFVTKFQFKCINKKEKGFELPSKEMARRRKI